MQWDHVRRLQILHCKFCCKIDKTKQNPASAAFAMLGESHSLSAASGSILGKNDNTAATFLENTAMLQETVCAVASANVHSAADLVVLSLLEINVIVLVASI